MIISGDAAGLQIALEDNVSGPAVRAGSFVVPFELLEMFAKCYLCKFWKRREVKFLG